MLKQLLDTTADRPEWVVLREAVEQGQHIHLAVMIEPYLQYLLDGKKTIESRFSKNAVAPFARVREDELVLLKASGGSIVGYFIVGRVEYLRLNPSVLARLKRDFGQPICADDAFWDERRDKRYATLITVRNVSRLSPASVVKTDRRGWVILRPSV